MFIGNEKIVAFFRDAMESGNLGHAYCLVGLGGIGKRTLAKQLAAKLLVIEVEKLANHPDYYYLERVEDEKTGKLKKEISIVQTRELKSRLAGKSWQGGFRVVIIDEAELLNEESSNALLKTLEEPGGKTVFFLLTEDDSTMLATIRSRCQPLYFELVSTQVLVQGLEEMGLKKDEAKEIASIAWGRPGRAINFYEDADTKSLFFSEIIRWEKIIGLPFYEKIKLTEDLFGDKTDHVRERGKLQKILDIWTMLWRETLLHKSGVNMRQELNSIDWQKKVENITVPQIIDVIDNLEYAKRLLGKNVHPKLLIEQVFLKF